MNEIMLDQGSEEWLDFRKNRIGASDAAIILGLSPYNTRMGLWNEKMGLSSFEETYAMRFGKENEEHIRIQMSIILGCDFQPKCFIDEVDGWLMCSVDGIDIDKGIVIEIKCANKEDHDLACRQVVPRKYTAQLQTIMHVCDTDKIWYCSYHQGDLQYFKVSKSPTLIDWMLPQLKEFWDSMQNFKKPEINEEHKETNKKKVDYVLNEGDEWERLSSAWSLIQIEKKKIEEMEKIHRERIMCLCEERNMKGLGLKVTNRERKGSIDYSSVVELQGIDLEKYRKETSKYWVIENE